MFKGCQGQELHLGTTHAVDIADIVFLAKTILLMGSMQFCCGVVFFCMRVEVSGTGGGGGKGMKMWVGLVEMGSLCHPHASKWHPRVVSGGCCQGACGVR